MEKFSTKLKTFFIIFFIVSVLYFALGVLSEYTGTQVLCSALLFPFGFLYVIIGKYLWNYYGPAHWINDEILGLFVLFVVIIAQTFVYYYIYKFVKARKKRKMEIQE